MMGQIMDNLSSIDTIDYIFTALIFVIPIIVGYINGCILYDISKMMR